MENASLKVNSSTYVFIYARGGFDMVISYLEFPLFVLLDKVYLVLGHQKFVCSWLQDFLNLSKCFLGNTNSVD